MWWIITVVLLYFVDRKVIILRLKKNCIPSIHNLNNRTRLALLLSGVSVLSFVLSIQKDRTNIEEKEVNDSIAFINRNIKLYESLPIAPYNATLYSQELIDSINNDYMEMQLWIKKNADSIHIKISKKEFINIDSLQIPVPNSPVAYQVLCDYRYHFINLLSRYNNCVNKLDGINKDKNKYDISNKLLNFLIPLLILISILLSLSVVEWNDKIEKRD